MLASMLAAACAPGPTRVVGTPPIVLIIIDTLRADHLGCYGYPLDTSPVLDAFARQATLFESNATQCNATFASITSILTGLYPRSHRSYLPVPMEGGDSGAIEVPSLAERMKALGYHTISVVSHSAWHYLSKGHAVGRGWDQSAVLNPFTRTDSRLRAYQRADYTNERVFRLLDRHAAEHADEPLFLWAHYYDPHAPYDPPEEVRNLFLGEHLARVGLQAYEAELGARAPNERRGWIRELQSEEDAKALVLANGRALYDAEIRHCDARLGEFFDRLRDDGLYDEALIVVMADHGENMDDLSWGHGGINFTHTRLFEGVARTPLLIKLPHQTEGVTVRALSQNIDLLPTLLELMDLPADPRLEGRSLVPLLDDPRARVHERVFSESSDGAETAVKTEQLKYIDPGLGAEPRLYLWREDPTESSDLIAVTPPQVVEQMHAWLSDFRPVNNLRVRFVPDGRPRRVALEVRLPIAHIVEAVAPPPLDDPRAETPPAWGGPADDDQLFRWVGLVEHEPIDLLLALDRPPTESLWYLEREGPGAVQDAVVIGHTPLAGSGIAPLYVPTDAGAREPDIAMSSPADARTLRLEVSGRVPGLVEVLLQFPDIAMKRSFELVAVDGFEPAGPGSSSTRYTLIRTARGDTSVELRALAANLPAVRAALRIDGAWPVPGQVAWNGQTVRADALGFRITPDALRGEMGLARAPDLDQAAPGAVLLWLDRNPGETEIDTSLLGEDMIETLRELGYLR